MITIQVTECELRNIIASLQSRRNKKSKRAEGWLRKKEVGLIIPFEVADAFITIDTHTANAIIAPLIERMEQRLQSVSIAETY